MDSVIFKLILGSLAQIKTEIEQVIEVPNNDY